MRRSSRKGKLAKIILDNGMTVLMFEDHRAPLVSIQLIVRAGSIYEGRYLGSGISHFLEHVIDDGTPTRTRAEIDKLIEKMGNAANAYTSKDQIKYYHTVLTEHFRQAIELLADCIQNPIFPPEEVEIQRGVILNEFNKDSDEPANKLTDLFYETAFRVHPVRYPVGGYRELFEKLTRDDLIKYYEETHRPREMVLVIGGDISPPAAAESVVELFGSFRGGMGVLPTIPDEPRQLSPRSSEIADNVEMTYSMLGFHTVDLFHEDVPALEIIAAALGTGESSRISRIVKDDKRLIHSFSTWADSPSYGAGVWLVEFESEPDKQSAAQQAILDEIMRLKDEGISEEELAKTKAIEEVEYLFSMQSIEEITSALGESEFATGDPEFAANMMERIKSVTCDDVLRAANRYFDESALTVSVIRPDVAVRRHSISIPVKPDPTGIERRILPNGITLLLHRDDSSPIVCANVVMPGGSSYESADKSGTFYLLSRMLLKGTTTRTAKEIADQIESIGASIDPFCGRELFGCSASFLSRDFDLCMSILFDVLRNSTIDPEEFAKVKEEAILDIKSECDDWIILSKSRFYQTMFRERAHEFYPIGKLESVEMIQLSDLLQTYHDYCSPSNMVISVFGDIDADAAAGKIEKIAGDWRSTVSRLPVPSPIEIVKADSLYEENLSQGVIILGYESVPIKSPQRPAVEVLSAIMSGSDYPGGRLYNALRNEQLIYLIYSHTYFGSDLGYLSVFAATHPDRVEITLDRIRREIAEIAAGNFGEEEVSAGKRMCIANHMIGLQTVPDKSAAAAVGECLGIGYDHIFTYERMINRVTTCEVKEVAEMILRDDKCVTTLLVSRE